MSTEDLPNELLVQILEYVPDVYKLNIVCKQFNDIVKDIEHRVFKNPNKYIEELSPPVYVLLKDNKYYKPIWDKAISKGNLDLVVKLNELGYKFNVDLSMCNAADGGQKNLVEFFIEKGAKDWNRAMAYAAYGGQKNLVEFFIEKGADGWNRAMAYAAYGGQKKLVEFFIEKGADGWNRAMVYAAKRGHKDMVDFLIERGADDWEGGMRFAADGGHEDLVKFFKEKLKI